MASGSRYYRPKMARLVKKEKVFLGAAEEAGIEYFVPEDLMTRRVVESIGGDTYEGQITYSFSSAIRRNTFKTRFMSKTLRAYGAKNFSFRLLYEFLCNTFNGGEYFIDTYFDRVFPLQSVSDRFDQLNDEIETGIIQEYVRLLGSTTLRKDGLPDMRFNTSSFMKNAKLWQDPIKKTAATRLAEEIKQDIVVCLSNGAIPLRKQSVSEKTAKERAKMPELDPRAFFYASGQLINHLNIYVEL